MPRNIIKVDFTIEKTQDIKGKYNSFAKEMLNADKYIKENKTTYSIKGVNISTLTEADPNMVFHIITGTDDKNKESVSLNLELNSEGVISSFGDIVNSTGKTYQACIADNELPQSKQLTGYHYIPIIDNDDEEEIVIDDKFKQKREPKYGRVFEGRVVTDEEYQQIIKYKRNDFSSLLEDVEREYEHLKELNK